MWVGSVLWSTTDDLASCNNGGNNTLGSGEAACADSDETNSSANPYDAELFSNSFAIPAGLSSVSLRFALSYNDIGTEDLFEVWAWDGGVGALRLQLDQDLNGIMNVDLGPYIGSSDLRVSFRYYGLGWDWWAQVDDVSIVCCFFCDGFESGDLAGWV